MAHNPWRNAPAIRTRLLAALTVLALLSAVGCSADESAPNQLQATPAPTQAPAPPNTDVAPTAEMTIAGANAAPKPQPQPQPQNMFTLFPSYRVPDPGCTSQWPIRLGTHSYDPEEKKYLDSVPICQNITGNRRVIINNSPAVWRLSSSNFTLFLPLSRTPQIDGFHEFVLTNDPTMGWFMAPGETVFLPTNLIGFRFRIDQDLTKAWVAYTIIDDQVTAYEKAALRGIITRGLKTRKAVFDCGSAFYTVLDNSGSLTSPDAAKVLLGGFTITAGAGTCATSWKAAEVELGRKEFSTLIDDVATAGKAAANVKKMNKLVTIIRGLCASGFRFC